MCACEEPLQHWRRSLEINASMAMMCGGLAGVEPWKTSMTLQTVSGANHRRYQTGGHGDAISGGLLPRPKRRGYMTIAMQAA